MSIAPLHAHHRQDHVNDKLDFPFNDESTNSNVDIFNDDKAHIGKIMDEREKEMLAKFVVHLLQSEPELVNLDALRADSPTPTSFFIRVLLRIQAILSRRRRRGAIATTLPSGSVTSSSNPVAAITAYAGNEGFDTGLDYNFDYSHIG